MRKIRMRKMCAAAAVVLAVPVTLSVWLAGSGGLEASAAGPGTQVGTDGPAKGTAAAGPGTRAGTGGPAEEIAGAGQEAGQAKQETNAAENENMTAAGPGNVTAAAAGPGRPAEQNAGSEAAVPEAPGSGTSGPGAAGPGAAGSEAAVPEAPGSGTSGPGAAGPGTAGSEAAGPGAAGPGAAGSGEETLPAESLPREVTEEEIDAYFDDVVLVGDSVMLGYRNYAMRRLDTWLGRVRFLCSGSYSTTNALMPVSATSIHPVFQGQQRPIWESIALMGAKKVFICFGLNDLNISGIEGTCENYKTIVSNIRSLTPDAEIHLISMTYTLAGKGKGKLNNDNIRLFNEALRQLTADNGWGYVDLAPHLADENGDLAPAYCSDYYVHQTPAAYDVWSAVLRDYARGRLQNTPELKPEPETESTPELKLKAEPAQELKL